MTLQVNQLNGFGAFSDAAVPKTVTFTDSFTSTADATTYTDATATIGTASSDRVIVVVAASQAATPRSVSTITIDGNNMTLVRGTAQDPSVYMYYLAYPTGTSASIAVTWSAGAVRCAFDVYALTGVGTGSGVTSGEDLTPSSSDLDATFDIAANSVVIAGACITSAASPTCTWTNLTEQTDRFIEGTANAMSSACDVFASAAPGTTITANFTSGTAGQLVYGVW